jgi:predicted dehydrogenase
MTSHTPPTATGVDDRPASQRLGVIMNGVTGRMGYRQHLVRSILAIRDDGGVDLGDGRRVVPEPILVGRNADKLAEMAHRHGVERWTTSLDEALADTDDTVYFDAQITQARDASVRAAIEAGKHVYSEKPIGESSRAALALAELAEARGVANGVVQDKLFLPGLVKLRGLLDSGFFGEILSVRGEFGYWVFEGDWRPAQRPSWNYRAEDGGGIALDMFAHWSYLLELFGPVRSVAAHAVTHIPQRWDEAGKPYRATADDAAYAIFEIGDGVVAQINSSWCVRVNRDELVEFQVDGTHGSAVAGLHGCRAQSRDLTPVPVWDPDVPTDARFRDQWQEVPATTPPVNAFRAQWELFIRHVCAGEPFPYDFRSGARGVRLAELGLESSAEGRRLPVGAS